MSSAHLKNFAQITPANIEWRNGLPFNLDFNDVYFSDSGGLLESEHVFIKGCQLENDWLTKEQDVFYLSELGFGSGLNFLQTASLWKKLFNRTTDRKKRLHYIAIEKHPLSLFDLKKTCQLWPELLNTSKELIENYPSITFGRHQINFQQHQLTLTLLFMPVETALNELVQENELNHKRFAVDHWFLDGFAPSKNNEMWNQSTIEKIKKLSKSASRVATFSVASKVKSALEKVDFEIKKVKGYGRKREVLTAQLKNQPSDKLSGTNINRHTNQYINLKYETPWFKKSFNSKPYKVAIIGAGVAGCATAYSLAKQGIKVDIFDSESDLAQKASGASAGIFHPQLTTDMNINSQFNWLAYLYLLRFIQTLSEEQKSSLIIHQGVNRLLDSKQQQDLLKIVHQLKLEPWITQSNSISDKDASVFYPQAAALDTYQFCKLLVNQSEDKVTFFYNQEVEALTQESQQWHLQTTEINNIYEHIIFCGGARSHLLDKLIDFPTQITRGQSCQINSNILDKPLSHCFSGKVYWIPNKDHYTLGATFDDLIDDKLNTQSQKQLLNQVQPFFEKLNINPLSQETIEKIPLRGKLGYRLHSGDRLPLVGAVPNTKKLYKDFSDLGQKRIKRVATNYYNTSGLWLNTAYGSHGLLYSLLASKHLANLITNDISPINQQISNAINPTRFIIKKIKRH